ncbi:hypothetical protein LWI29_011373 [Acer saccharum]|uniref:Uncharacterized protein n=1 Tax=Acer saccharum TaxID=4024 RepID=A0AA39RRN9_ACESA|nr:hypothetical protein LWI29_011373 [Acer saccharum]
MTISQFSTSTLDFDVSTSTLPSTYAPVTPPIIGEASKFSLLSLKIDMFGGGSGDIGFKNQEIEGRFKFLE